MGVCVRIENEQKEDGKIRSFDSVTANFAIEIRQCHHVELDIDNSDHQTVSAAVVDIFVGAEEADFEIEIVIEIEAAGIALSDETSVAIIEEPVVAVAVVRSAFVDS